jgi:hypothetical protein
MRVIGVGLARTGTVSLKAAVEQLGFGPCFHSRYVLDHADRLPLWNAAANGETVDWGTLFEGYGSSMAWPGAAFWRQLMAYYPDAKAILTERDPERWYDSVKNTIYQLTGDGTGDLVEAAREQIPSINGMHRFNRTLIWDGFFGGRFGDREHALRAFEEHNAAVRREVPADRLLVFSVREGWEPLCRFLDVPVPDEPFPHLNDTDTYWAQVRDRLAETSTTPS